MFIKYRVAALEQESADFGSRSDLLIRVLAARDGGEAILARLSPGQRRAFDGWLYSPALDRLVQSFQKAASGSDLPSKVDRR